MFHTLSEHASQEGLQLNRSQLSVLPPSSLLRFLRKNSNLTAVVLGDYNQGYSNRWAGGGGGEGNTLL